MSVSEQFLDQLAEYACWELKSSGLRLPLPLNAVVTSLSEDTGVSEQDLRHEIIVRVRAIKGPNDQVSTKNTVGVALRNWLS